MVNTALEILAFMLVVLGVAMLAGVPWAVLVAGIVLGVYVEVGDYLDTRAKPRPRPRGKAGDG